MTINEIAKLVDVVASVTKTDALNIFLKKDNRSTSARYCVCFFLSKKITANRIAHYLGKTPQGIRHILNKYKPNFETLDDIKKIEKQLESIW